MTVGKRVQFDDETWAMVNLQERRLSFQKPTKPLPTC